MNETIIPVKIKVGAHGGDEGAQVLLGDLDVTKHVSRLEVSAAPGERTLVRLELHNVTVDADLKTIVSTEKLESLGVEDGPLGNTVALAHRYQ